MVDFLNKPKLINPSQYGFFEEITKWVDDGLSVNVIYWDFKKAFDNVPNQRLIYSS